MKSVLEARRAACIAAATVGLVAAAGARNETASEEKTPESVAADVLAVIAENFWQQQLRNEPVGATILGDRRYDHLLADITPEALERERASLVQTRRLVTALVPGLLSANDRITYSMLLDVIDGGLAVLDCGFQDWVVDPLDGPQVAFQNIPAVQSVDTPEQARAMVQRWRAMGPYLDAHVANLQGGLAAGRVATRNQVERVLQQLDEVLDEMPDEGALLSPLATEHPDWSEAERAAFARDLRTAVRKSIQPALLRYRDFLRKEVLPRSRPQDKVGIANIPGGEACYAAMIRRHTSLALQPQEIHRLGLAEVERIMAAMRELGQSVFGTADQAEILKRLRSDPALHFATREEVESKASEALGRAQAAIPHYFGILPQAPCVVVRMEPYEEQHSTIAYYRQPAVDGSRPGNYYINTYAPETRPRYEAEALAFHEAIPGHHLQIAIAQELRDMPAFRKHMGTTAFVEGWGLYAEQLADEMGLYSADLDRMGKLSFEAWRACRLVVDTGMHALNWSRQQAIDFMLANTALAENNIVNEVDRYITWPGQALAYKLGQLEILKLRDEARRQRGDAFDLREFHDVVLRNGAVSLATLRGIVEAHYAAAPGAAAGGGR